MRIAGDRGRIVVTALLAAVLAVGAAGCSAAPAAPPVLQPGLPGEPNRVPSAEDVERATAPQPPNDSDVMFMQMMVPHHEQALEMSGLVAERAESPRVRGLAERITTTQGGEIAVMETWLGRHAAHAAHGDHHAHDGMPGMATAEQIAALTAARGAEFDRLFLELMITHHGGAVTMATDVLTSGAALEVEQLATDVITEQTVEISRMRRLLGA